MSTQSDTMTSMETTDLTKFNLTHLLAARDLCAGAADNVEYVRGIAELLIDTTHGVTMDEHKDMLIAYLGAPLVLVDSDACAGGECKDINRLCSKHSQQYQRRYGRASNE